MKIYLARHGETRLNKAHLMQGRYDEPLNETGIRQAQTMRRILLDAGEDLHFDAVYASPLQRAVTTATILADVPAEAVITDERLLEADFGKYEKRPYTQLGPWMTLYWRYPEYFPAPKTVETLDSMISRSHAFLKELEQKDYDVVLVACHGGILRPLSGYLMDRKSGVYWRPKPKNCDVRVFTSEDGRHRTLHFYSL